ncbi:AAA family ATPase [Burkholderia cenocepacia]|uniref:AAA family ATPase n=1 Tax=Burkholderia cenocepacia TaxID=95486 RepID=UPI001CF2DDCF|nr:AAA family ATPase [Burkholderia cenocepacia]MCA8082696.1 AAA family ATPase [Burkholderia cenocepacia]
MKLNSIELSNYRCYETFQASFGDGVNVIAGVNGSGKTSLLKAIRDALSIAIMHSGMGIASLSPLAESDSTHVKADQIGNRWRFEPQYPTRVTAYGEVNGVPLKWEAISTSSIPGHQRIEGVSPTREVHIENRVHITYPVLAFYPAYRSWPATNANETMAAIQTESRAAGYQSWWEASSDSGALQLWAIAKSMERMQAATDNATGWDGVDDDELAQVAEALSAVIGDAKGLRYDFTQKTLLIEWSNGKSPTPFRHLSDGQRVAIALIVDIARRMCALNPHLGSEILKNTPGVVLIDELDNHLHPKWQRLMVRGLVKAFPKVQFICASHSPQILSELRPENILLLTLDGAAHPQASYGLDANRILEQIMDADPRPSEVEDDLTQLFICIEQNKLTDARILLDKLKNAIPGLPELAGAETLIKRKEVIGR